MCNRHKNAAKKKCVQNVRLLRAIIQPQQAEIQPQSDWGTLDTPSTKPCQGKEILDPLPRFWASGCLESPQGNNHTIPERKPDS